MKVKEKPGCFGLYDLWCPYPNFLKEKCRKCKFTNECYHQTQKDVAVCLGVNNG